METIYIILFSIFGLFILLCLGKIIEQKEHFKADRKFIEGGKSE